jgi:hypothetical protein
MWSFCKVVQGKSRRSNLEAFYIEDKSFSDFIGSDLQENKWEGRREAFNSSKAVAG